MISRDYEKDWSFQSFWRFELFNFQGSFCIKYRISYFLVHNFKSIKFLTNSWIKRESSAFSSYKKSKLSPISIHTYNCKYVSFPMSNRRQRTNVLYMKITSFYRCWMQMLKFHSNAIHQSWEREREGPPKDIAPEGIVHINYAGNWFAVCIPAYTLTIPNVRN